ncbi:MAG: tetratricopeptide repeat protein [Myxococcales bacterium]|nr:tetratricopeptide repeat protein [Myxococcales bacterium]
MSRALLGLAVLAFGLASAHAPSVAAPARSRGAAWGWITRSVAQLAQNKLADAVRSAHMARRVSPRPQPEIDALVGLAALAGGRIADARQQLASAIKAGSSEALVLYWSGRAELAGGARAQALARFEQAIAVGGDKPLLRMAQAITLRALGRAGAARKAMARVVAVMPNIADPSLYPTARSGAVELLSVLLGKRFPRPLFVHRTQGHLQWRLGRPLSAMRHFAVLLAANKRDGDALQMTARCLLALGRLDAAAQLAARAVSAAPDLPQAIRTRGEVALARGKARDALSYLKKAASLLPRDASLLLRVAKACNDAEKLACAERYYGYALKRDARLAEAHFGLAVLQQQGKRSSAAKKSLARALALEPGNPRFYQGAAALSQQWGDKRAAQQYLRQARAAQRVLRRFERRRDAVRAVGTKLALALERCACAPAGCKPSKAQRAGCDAAVKTLAPPLRVTFSAHLAKRVASVTPPQARRVLLTNPIVLISRAKTYAREGYTLRSVLPIVAPRDLR